MRPKPASAVVLALLLVAAGAAVPAAAQPPSPVDGATSDATPVVAAPAPGGGTSVVADSTAGDTAADHRNGTAPPDPATDRLGWENGRWYNESLPVTPVDGLNGTELDAVVARTMARVERIRELEFERTPPVRVINRSQQRAETGQVLSNVSRTTRLQMNAKYEALFMINESFDAMDSRRAFFGSGVAGYYSPTTGNVTIVSENESDPKMDEITLAQELFHALQDNRFDVSYVSTLRREEHNALDGILEGDGDYVTFLYRQRCEREWNGTCVTPESDRGSADVPPELEIGMVQTTLQPYNSGIAFVRGLRRAGGWDAVDAVYENPPASTEQTIHPDRYPDDEPTNLTVPDRSGDGWKPLERNGSQIKVSMGEAGLFVALWLPGFETQRARTVIPYRSHLNVDPSTGELAQPVSFNYSHPATTGWDGDAVVPYVSTDNETGYVFTTAWDSPAEAREFAAAYRELLAVRGAQPVEGHDSTYRIPEGKEFADAFYLARNGSRLTVVNAPTVAALDDIRRGAAPESETTTAAPGTTTTTEPTTTATTEPTTTDPPVTTAPTGDRTDRPGDDETGETDATTTTGAGPGFGVAAGVAGLLVAVLALAGRRVGR